MIALQGILQSSNPSTPLPPPYELFLEVSEAVAGSPAYQAAWNDTEYSKTLNTSGTQTSSGRLRVSTGNDVDVNITRTGNADDVVDIEYFINDVPYGSGDTVSAGNPVNVNKTFAYLDISPGDELKITITEG